MNFVVEINLDNLVLWALLAIPFTYWWSWMTFKKIIRPDFGYFILWITSPAVIGVIAAPFLGLFMLWKRYVFVGNK